MCPLGTDYVVFDALRLAAIWRHKTKSSPQGDTSYSYLNSHISDLRSPLKKIDLISISLEICRLRALKAREATGAGDASCDFKWYARIYVRIGIGKYDESIYG